VQAKQVKGFMRIFQRNCANISAAAARRLKQR
jgi:hypothetical protein